LSRIKPLYTYKRDPRKYKKKHKKGTYNSNSIEITTERLAKYHREIKVRLVSAIGLYRHKGHNFI